jgi:hypothetical protein
MVVGKGLDRVREVDVMEPGTQALDVVKDMLFINQAIPFSFESIWFGNRLLGCVVAPRTGGALELARVS